MSVWMMPGQGAQKVGMGADLLVLPEVQETFEMAKEWLYEELKRLQDNVNLKEVSE